MWWQLHCDLLTSCLKWIPKYGKKYRNGNFHEMMLLDHVYLLLLYTIVIINWWHNQHSTKCLNLVLIIPVITIYISGLDLPNKNNKIFKGYSATVSHFSVLYGIINIINRSLPQPSYLHLCRYLSRYILLWRSLLQMTGSVQQCLCWVLWWEHLPRLWCHHSQSLLPVLHRIVWSSVGRMPSSCYHVERKDLPLAGC